MYLINLLCNIKIIFAIIMIFSLLLMFLSIIVIALDKENHNKIKTFVNDHKKLFKKLTIAYIIMGSYVILLPTKEMLINLFNYV